jgi:hypothetical protein
MANSVTTRYRIYYDSHNDNPIPDSPKSEEDIQGALKSFLEELGEELRAESRPDASRPHSIIVTITSRKEEKDVIDEVEVCARGLGLYGKKLA